MPSMNIKVYHRLQSILSQFNHIYEFIDDAFIRAQCDSELKNYLLHRLANEDSSLNTLRHLPTLEKRLAELVLVTGYDKLAPLLKGASDWDKYQEALAQIDITLWFNQKNLLKEIEPRLPHRVGNADFLLSFSQQDIYSEVGSFQSIIKSIESKAKSEEKRIQKRLRELRKGQPWRTEQHVENELEIERAVRSLLDKTKRQLPPNHPGILALDTTKSAKFAYDIRSIANKLLPQRPQVTLIGLWSWEGVEETLNWDKNPTCFFINGGSRFQEIGEALVQFLSVKGEIIGKYKA